MAKSAGSAFTGGKLSLKGDKTKPKKKSTTSKPKRHGKIDESDNTSASANSAGRRSHSDGIDETNKNTNVHNNNSSDDEDLTAAEKRSRKFKQQRERKELEQVVSMSHRERVEQFNEKLGKLTELNDIPRVSAAGNG